MPKRKSKLSDCCQFAVTKDGKCTFCGSTADGNRREAEYAQIAKKENARQLRRRIVAEGNMVLEEADCVFDGCDEGAWHDTNKPCPVCGGTGRVWREVSDHLPDAGKKVDEK